MNFTQNFIRHNFFSPSLSPLEILVARPWPAKKPAARGERPIDFVSDSRLYTALALIGGRAAPAESATLGLSLRCIAAVHAAAMTARCTARIYICTLYSAGEFADGALLARARAARREQ